MAIPTLPTDDGPTDDGPTDDGPTDGPSPVPARRRRRRWTGLAATALAGVAVAACGTAAAATGSSDAPACGATAPKLTVTGSGQASSAPDELTLNIGVTVSGATASDALTAENTQASALTASLTGAGVAAADLTTTNFSITPNLAPNGTVTGYQVSNDLVATLRNLADAGAVIDAAARSAGNSVRILGLSYSVSNSGNVDGRARAAAILTASAHATAMARAAGETLHGVCSISDSTNGGYPANGLAYAAAGTAQGTVPLEPGTEQSTAQVTVVYALS